MNVRLTGELERFVEERVASGRYGSPSEVIGEGLRLLEQDERSRAAVREHIALGVAQAKAGDLHDGEEFFAQLEAELAAEESARNASRP